MYLKKIIAQGFKSFADNIVIDLNSDIAVIVGPNGSGKSNVVDAVRWVLGEQSVKSLRGDDTMTDIIFAGSKSRKPLSVANVTLIFDNKDKYLALDEDEVSIKRRLYKDGTNEYFINNEKVRLKDIHTLILDSGMGKESFNIIGQGQISNILSEKAVDRRVMFEEAAGVLKYKKRKEEAIRKLDKTHENMNRVMDIINELDTQIEPLKKQKDRALRYFELSDELKNLDISLITYDIENINNKYLNDKKKIDELTKEITSISVSNTKYDVDITNLKNSLIKLNNDINIKQKELIDITTKVEQINGEKNIILERKKYEVDNTKLHNQVLALKESQLVLNNEINSIKLDLDNIKVTINKLNTNKTEIDNTIDDVKKNKQTNELYLTKLIREHTILNNKINNLKESIENSNTLPSSVRNIIDNPKLSGIHNCIGNIIEVEEQYSKAISTTLGGASNYIIVDNEVNAKEAINYLKINNKGRATFFPLNIIKSKSIDNDTYNIIKSLKGFVDIANNLVKNNSLYNDIVGNQLGNVIVVDNIDNANIISKKINYKYRIVTLEGELLHVGGSLTGGNYIVKNIITEKYELENSIKLKNELEINIKNIENILNELDYKLKSYEDKLYLINKDIILNNEIYTNKNNILLNNISKYEEIERNIRGTTNIINDNLSDEEDKILNEYYSAINYKNELNNTINKLLNQKETLNNQLENIEYCSKKDNNIYNQKNNELKALEIDVNRADVKLDSLLNQLNENYNITYEYAHSHYKLELETDVVRTKISSLKHELKDLEPINATAPEEYEKVKERYEFLHGQYDDLINAENTLLEIINEMDEVMGVNFLKTFNVINENFTKTFKELFKGGNAMLKLTNPNNILETGIEIVASPPGKSLKSISLLSGGEKTFTAISLLFAILKSRPVPFCILDEVEAALDEVNVESFGEYLQKLQDKTQFIIITHKKKTMEYANVLYGITMQESGVSKLVSVKIEDIK